MLHEQLPTCVPACVCVCVLCVGSVTNDLYPPPLAVADFGLRRTGVLYKQTSKQETASRVEGTGQSGVGYALGGGGAEAKGMGDDQMDAGISEHRFIISPLDGDKTSDEVDVRVPCRFGAGGWQQDIHTKVVFAAVALTGFFSGRGRLSSHLRFLLQPRR